MLGFALLSPTYVALSRLCQRARRRRQPPHSAGCTAID